MQEAPAKGSRDSKSKRGAHVKSGAADLLRDEGNQAYKKGSYLQAKEAYTRCQITAFSRAIGLP